VKFIVLSSLAVVVACGPAPRAAGVYGHDTRALVRLDYDYDGDGRIDVRTYMRDGRPVRLEGDGNGDGVVDRWEYYDRRGALVRLGAASQQDGREDTWTRVNGAERSIELSTHRDGIVDRREIYRGDALVRVEADTNRDGLVDTWQEFEGGVLRRLLLDERRAGKPTREVEYGAGGGARVATLGGTNGDAAR
jgi:hypothetical protein